CGFLPWRDNDNTRGRERKKFLKLDLSRVIEVPLLHPLCVEAMPRGILDEKPTLWQPIPDASENWGRVERFHEVSAVVSLDVEITPHCYCAICAHHIFGRELKLLEDGPRRSPRSTGGKCHKVAGITGLLH